VIFKKIFLLASPRFSPTGWLVTINGPEIEQDPRNPANTNPIPNFVIFFIS
jgi:hypothetical protein